jgi:hypothetical protein
MTLGATLQTRNTQNNTARSIMSLANHPPVHKARAFNFPEVTTPGYENFALSELFRLMLATLVSGLRRSKASVHTCRAKVQDARTGAFAVQGREV